MVRIVFCGPGIELIPHPGRHSMSLCGKESIPVYVIQNSLYKARVA